MHRAEKLLVLSLKWSFSLLMSEKAVERVQVVCTEFAHIYERGEDWYAPMSNAKQE